MPRYLLDERKSYHHTKLRYMAGYATADEVMAASEPPVKPAKKKPPFPGQHSPYTHYPTFEEAPWTVSPPGFAAVPSDPPASAPTSVAPGGADQWAVWEEFLNELSSS